MPEPSPRSVLVTGASSGIGEALVGLLARSGWHVFAGVRSAGDADRVEGSPGVEALRFDVVDRAQREEAQRSLESRLAERRDPGLDALVNAAGTVVPGPLEVLPLEDLREQFEVNVFGLHAWTQACLPLLRRSRAPRGARIVQVSSISGRVAFPMEGAYNASKFALEGLTDTLRLELRGSGVSITLVEPGVVRTPIWGKIQSRLTGLLPRLDDEARARYQPRIEGFQRELQACSSGGVSPERVAERILRSLEAKHAPARIRIGRGAHLWDFAARVLPTSLRDRWILSRTSSSS